MLLKFQKFTFFPLKFILFCPLYKIFGKVIFVGKLMEKFFAVFGNFWFNPGNLFKILNFLLLLSLISHFILLSKLINELLMLLLGHDVVVLLSS